MGLKTKFVLSASVLLLCFSIASTLINIRSQQRIARERLVGKAVAMTSLLAESASDPLTLLYVEDLRLLLSDVLAAEEVVYAFVFDEEGRILTDGTRRVRSRFRALEDDVSRNAVAASELLVQQRSGLLDVTEPIFLGSKRLGGVRIGFSLEKLEGEAAAIRDRNLGLGAGFVLVGVCLAMAMVVRVTRPLGRLVEFTRAVSRGELDRRVRVDTRDELALLANSFNSMTESLRTSQETLQAAHDELEERVAERTDDLLRANAALERRIVETRELETQLRESQKMEAVGRLAAGVAHDFNNLLTAILGYSNLLLADLAPDDPRREEIEEIKVAGERAASLTEQLLTFGRKQTVHEEVLDLNAMLGGMGSLIRRLVGEDVDLVIELEPKLGPVEVDAGQIQQVILNLTINARDAMPDGGTLTLRTSNLEVREGGAAGELALAPGSWVVLSVRDTGIGMDAETRSHIFEPFFTTKEWSAGTGLGLSTVYGILQQSRGCIAVESEPGRGSEFRAYLPSVESTVPVAPEPETVLPPLQGSETVLIAEDESSVRRLASRTLQRLGYRVLVARSGIEALELERKHDGPIHLLVSDVVMPGMSGPELVGRLTRLRPGLKTLLISGYAKGAKLDPHCGDAFLRKPFTPQDLGGAVRELLDAT